MLMTKLIFKYIAIVSFVVGIIFGIISAIPYIGGIGLLGALLFAAPIVILLLIMAGKADITTPKDSIISGGIIGFISNITFSFSYAAIVSIIYVLFGYTSNYFLTAMIINTPIWLFIIIVFFMGVLTGTTNAFSAFITYYIINLLRDIYDKTHGQG